MRKIELHQRLTSVLQRSYHTHRAILRIYWQLSKRMPNKTKQEILQVLANASAQRAARCTRRLQRLGVTALPDRDSWVERLWRWMVLHYGIRLALTWTDWLEQRDRQRYWAMLHNANAPIDEPPAVVSCLHLLSLKVNRNRNVQRSR